MRTVLAWSAHAFTALGLIAAALIAVAIVRGDYRGAFLLMLAATLIDAVDGTYARAVRVSAALPNFDGRRLDDLIDFHTFTTLPLLLIWRAKILPAGDDFWLLLPLVASAYGFCQVEAKTADGYFRGFPSYWNIVAFYLYSLPWPPGWALALVVGLALLTFVPTVYLYPTRRGKLNLVANLLAAVWAVVLIDAIVRLPASRPATIDARTLASLAYPAFYMAASFTVTVRRKKRAPPSAKRP